MRSHPETAQEEREQQALTLTPAPATTALAVVPAKTEKTVAMHGKKWHFPGDKVVQVTEELPEFERDMFRWLHRHASGCNLSTAEVAAMLKRPDGSSYSADSVYQAMTGRRSDQGANLLPMAEAICALRKRLAETDPTGPGYFVETPTSRRLFKICRKAFLQKRVVFVFGESQVGKTTSVTQYAKDHNHGETWVFRFPTQGSLSQVVMEMARRMNIPTKNVRQNELRQRIYDAIDDSMLLIFDEAHQAMYGYRQAYALEFIREIHDRRKCGIVLIGTNVLREGMLENKMLSQLWKRRSPGLTLQLPGMVPPEDLAAFAAHFGLGPAPDQEMAIRYQATGVDGKDHEKRVRMNPAKLQEDIVRRDGLGPWLRLLDDSHNLAKAKNATLTWPTVITQYCVASAMEGGEG